MKKGYHLLCFIMRWIHFDQNPDTKISKFKNIYEGQKAREYSGESHNFMQYKKKAEPRIRKAGHKVHR